MLWIKRSLLLLISSTLLKRRINPRPSFQNLGFNHIVPAHRQHRIGKSSIITFSERIIPILLRNYSLIISHCIWQRLSFLLLLIVDITLIQNTASSERWLTQTSGMWYACSLELVYAQTSFLEWIQAFLLPKTLFNFYFII